MTVATPVEIRPPGARVVPPRASSMIEALRGLGYSPESALADIIDNSISAGAASVALKFVWAGGTSHVSVMDNGTGMDDKELEAAMRLGERSPVDERNASDLGRFGLGLKTASFSQCRRLTVASIHGGGLSCLRWDLDVLSACPDDGWHLLEGPAAGSEQLLQPLLSAGRGTLVVWEHLDRIVPLGSSEQDFLEMIDGVERHLAMVFHRYLDSETSRLRLALTINDRPLKPWDPFLRNHPATWSSPVERIQSETGTVEVQCHVLPHKDHLSTQQESVASGPHGWTVQQGFYVYRNRRLLLPGSWLGLGQGRSWSKEEAHRLARLRLDIPNSADAAWKIDIRKSTASPPPALKGHLTKLAEETRARARRVFAHRGQPVAIDRRQPVVQAWRAEHATGGIRYRIDRDHPAVRSVLDDAGDMVAPVRAMLRVIEETVPVQRIWLDTTEGKETPRTNFAGQPTSEVYRVLMVMFRNLVLRKNFSPQLARQRLLQTEPFNNYQDLIASLPDDLYPGEQNGINE